MKNNLIFIFLLTLSFDLSGQVVMPDSYYNPQPYHQHKGFYLSMALGPVFGKISDDITSYTMYMEGAGALFDIKIGGSPMENLILHATLTSAVMPGPSISLSTGQSGKANNSMSVDETMAGLGFTYYFRQSNFFVSASAGVGDYSITDDNNSSNNITTHEGLSLQLKAGKEWWISDKWALGLAFTYGKTRLTNKVTGSPTEKLDSNRIGIVMNASFSK
jgi:hypothetical protein